MRRGRLALLAVLALAACDDMISQPRKNPYADAAVGPGPVPPQTVSFEDAPIPRPPLTDGLLARGQEEFRAFCVPCHGEAGQANGMVVQRGFSAPPSYHIARLRAAPDQHFYDVITRGWGAMYSFAARVRPVDRWAIVAYIRALQRSQDVPAATLTVAEREALR